MEFDLESPFTSCLEQHQSEYSILDLFASESDHLPSRGFVHCLATCDLLASFRRQAVSLVFQAQFSCKCDFSVAYLAVNYMDRFMSTKEIIPEGKPWAVRLLVIACLSLASKMRNTGFSPSNFQRELGGDCSMFDTRTINRMELLILDALDWRMRSITPISFFPFFVSLLGLSNNPLEPALINRAKEIVFKAQNETKLLEFKPSTIAASAILVAQAELLSPSGFAPSKRSVLASGYVKKDKLEVCLSALQGMVELESYECVLDAESSSGTRKSPLILLDGYHYSCTNEKSEHDTNSTSSMVTPDIGLPEKRRKLN